MLQIPRWSALHMGKHQSGKHPVKNIHFNWFDLNFSKITFMNYDVTQTGVGLGLVFLVTLVPKT